MKSRFLILLYLLVITVSLSACREPGDAHTPLERLLIDVFAPQPGETVLIMMDLPHGQLADHAFWIERRAMAEEWHESFVELADELQISVQPMLTYMATGAHNGPLPPSAESDGREVSFDEIVAGANIVVAMTEFSATAPLFGFTDKYPELRAASMPGVIPRMMDTALAADYALMAGRCQLLAGRLDRATAANLTFSTGHELFIDLRNRKAGLDDGRLHSGKQGERVINLPSGEAYIAPYEGELPNQPSETTGHLPLPTGESSFVTLQLEENRVVTVEGKGPEAEDLRLTFSVDDGRRNLAELGMGCNDMAVITGNILEDEKVMGVHLASGLSKHIGGTVGVDAFKSPGDASHQDVVYPFGADIEVISLVFEYEDGVSETIIQNGQYTLFDY
jgi:hypothetical protein